MIYYKKCECYKDDCNICKKYYDVLMKIKDRIKNKYIYDILYYYRIPYKNEMIKLQFNINVNEIILLDNVIRKFKHVTEHINILEIDCAYGISGMTIMNRLGLNKNNATLSSIDPFQYERDDFRKIYEKSCYEYKPFNGVGVYNITHVLEQYDENHERLSHKMYDDFSNIVLKKLYEKGETYDCIFIDGSHEYDDVVIDVDYSVKLIKNGGYIVFDDVLHKGVAPVLKKFIKKYNLEKIYDVKTMHAYKIYK